LTFVREGDPRARFVVSVWRDHDTEAKTSYYTARNEAEEAFRRLKSGGRFRYGAVGEWIRRDEKDLGLGLWERLDAWPGDFEGKLF
jgi:hypothetical protein